MQTMALTPVVAEQEPTRNDQTSEAVEKGMDSELERELRIMLELESADESTISEIKK
jgi:hypothetical protein